MVNHSGGVVGFVIIGLLIVFMAGRLVRSFRRTTRMIKRGPDWGMPGGPDPWQHEGHQPHAGGHEGADGGHGGHSGGGGDGGGHHG